MSLVQEFGPRSQSSEVWGLRKGGTQSYLTESVYGVVSQKSISVQICQVILHKAAQIRQPILYHYYMKDKLADFGGNSLLHNDFVYTFCEIRPSKKRTGQLMDMVWGLGKMFRV